MAASLKEQVIAADVASDARWDTYEWRTLAMAHGLRACWSTPILSSDETVLGTFAIYSREPGSPTPQHQHLIGQITHLATVAIEQKCAEEAQAKRKRAATTHRCRSSTYLRLGAGWELSLYHQVAREYHGLSPNDPQEDHLAMFIHPDDREMALSERQRLISIGDPYELEARLLGKDGQYRSFSSVPAHQGMNRDISAGGMGHGRRSKTVNARRRSSVKTNGSSGASPTPSINALPSTVPMEKFSM